MYLTIHDGDGNLLGDLNADPDRLWLDMLLYVSKRWEAQALAVGAAMTAVLAAVPG